MADDSCKTRYPIVLIHGAGFRDLKWPVYWGRIPKAQPAGQDIFVHDICDIYIKIASGLKDRGL